ncbi:hypothetical protein GCM10025867_14680 [Frondihabitans sucicola]|uniref:Integral membrane protein n=1 Tax=Frondihabitans sucicola TaxID=1268041 RepID=A0ABM8GLD3_9MICO|nr:hypothetical protein [Frondihabitans sucicola]BDZ49227.1 hypothetical protein GCM10025867_14680 [Frondihabitans sucicola]
MNGNSLPTAPPVRPVKPGDVAREHLDHPDTLRAFRAVKAWILVYLGIGVIALVVTVLLRNDSAEVNANVWSRSAGVVVSAGLLYGFAVLASRGRRWAYRRLRIVSIVVPIAIAAIVISPGFPLWMRLEQVVCGLVVIGLAVAINGRHLRSLFTAAAPQN